jgi:hypothetical protein
MSDLSVHCPEFEFHCCKEAKLRHANKASSSSSRASQSLGLAHADTFGPYPKVYRGSDMRQFSQMTMPVSLGPVSLEKPDISKLKPFGCLMYGFVHKAQSSDWKMDPLGIAMACVGA